MTWDDDDLEYGYLVERDSTEGWWHLHFGRSAFNYPCELLGRSTNVVACVQYFGKGGVRQSPLFLLTLDGEGIELRPAEIRLAWSWGQKEKDANLLAQAKDFQQAVMPLLYESEAMQRAVAEIVQRRQHLRLVAPGKLQRE